MNGSDLVLVVDDEAVNRKLAQELLTSRGYQVAVASDGEEAVSKVRTIRPDLILLDVMMPRLDGLQTCRILKQDDETRLIPIVLLTALSSMEDRVAGIEVGADDFLTKPFNKVELLARVRSLIRVKHLNDQLERTENILFALAVAVEAKDPYTEGHLHRLEEYASRISSALALPAHAKQVNEYGALLHDIGKIGIPEAILNKPRKLTPEEFAIIKQHPEIGERICRPLRFGAEISPIVRGHHERWDGGGYPDGLAGEAIPLGARIVAVADAFDAMTTDRPYRKALALEKAWKILREGAGTQWDAAVVDAFASVPAGRVGVTDSAAHAGGALHRG
jgi:putative two-component system response regulator